MKKLILLLTLVSAVFLTGLLFSSCEKDEYNKLQSPPSNGAVNNTIPEISGIVLHPSTINAGGAILINVEATDPEGSSLAYTFEASGGTVEAYGGIALWRTPSTAGENTIKVSVSNGRGGMKSITQTVYIPPSTTLLSGFVKIQSSTLKFDLNGAKASIYKTYSDLLEGKPYVTKAVDNYGNHFGVFNISDLQPGDYYLTIGPPQAPAPGKKSSANDNSSTWVKSISASNSGSIKIENSKVTFCNICF